MQPSTARDSGQVDPRRGGLMAQADRLGPKVGRHLASCYIHRMNRGELSWCFKHDDNTIKIILVLLSLILSYMATSSDRDCCLLYTVTLGCFVDSWASCSSSYLTRIGRWRQGMRWDPSGKAEQGLWAWERPLGRCDGLSRTCPADLARWPNSRCIHSHVSRTCHHKPITITTITISVSPR